MTHENNDYVNQLRAHGYRVTLQRLIVLDAVCAVGGHATLNDILARVKEMDPSVDLSTVYRSLDVLVDAELVVATDLGEKGRVYRVSASSDHHHLVCEGCGRILTIPETVLAGLIETVRLDFDFDIRTEHLALPGRCRSCQ